MFLHPDADVRSRLVALVDDGEPRVEIAGRVPLSELPPLHEQAEVGGADRQVAGTPAGLPPPDYSSA